MKLMNSKTGSKDRQVNHKLSGLKMRRSPHIVMYFQRGRLVAENYLTRRAFRINSDSLVLLNFFSTWKAASDASRKFRYYARESIVDSIQKLADSDLLMTKDFKRDTTEHEFGAEWLWPTASRYYHFSTKINEPHNSPADIKQYYERYLKGRKQPSIY